MRLYTIGFLALAAAAMAAAAGAQTNPFAGTWNITPEPPAAGVYWLEVKDEGGKVSRHVPQPRRQPGAAENVKISDGELSFMVAGTARTRPTATFRVSGDKLTGTVGKVSVTGERPPVWGACDANAKHTFGKPVVLFDGTSMDAWDVQHKDRPMNWTAADGAMTNASEGKQPRLERKVPGLPSRRRIQGLAEGQQRHLPARPLRDAGAGRCRRNADASTATCRSTRARRPT